MADKLLPTIEELRQLLRYEPETGKLYWRPRSAIQCFHPRRSPEKEAERWNKQFAGKEAGSPHRNGYVCIHLLGKKYYAHRLAFAIFHGFWPEVTDHANGVRDDNRIANLKSVTRYGNMRNVRKPANNTSGRAGVVWSEARQKWWAQIKVKGVSQYLGIYALKEDAIRAREDAEMKYGFSKRHGR